MKFDGVRIRASSLTAFMDCERRWAARQFEKLIADMGITLRQTARVVGAAVGTAVHAGAAITLGNKLTTGSLAPDQVAADAGVAEFEHQFERESVEFDEKTPNRDVGRRQVERMVRAYNVQIAPAIQPLAVERQMEAMFGPLLVMGRPDVLPDNGLHDTKTGARQTAHFPQYGTYALLARANGWAPAYFVEDYIPRGTINKPQTACSSSRFDIATCERMAQTILNRVVDQAAAFAATQDPWTFLPNPSSILCSDRFCPAWGTEFCKAHLPKKERP